MADIATLGYRIDSRELAQGERALDAQAKAAGRAETATAKLEKQAQQLGKAWGTVAGIIGSAVITGTIRKVISATIEQEKVTAQLEARLRSTKGASGLLKDELLDMASGLQAVTTYGDEAIIGAQNLLLTFTKIGRDVFPQALETVLDMSTAMGQDLKSSAMQLGKALNDPVAGVAALTRVGVQFTDAQKEMIKEMAEAGRIADAQRVVLAELETQMGGSARAARDTLGGAIEGLKNAFGDLLEGDSGSDGVRGTKSAIEELTKVMASQQTKDAFASMVSGIMSVTASMVEGISTAIAYHQQLSKASTLGRSDFMGGMKEGWSALLSGDLQGAAAGGRRARGGAARFLFGSEFDNVQGGGDTQAGFDPRTQGLPENWGLNVNPNGNRPSGGGGGGRGRSGRSAADEAAREAEKLQREMERLREAQLGWNSRLLDMEASLAGPIAEATRQHTKDMGELMGAYERGEVTLADYTKLQEVLTQRRDAEIEAINAQLTPAQQLIEDLEFEFELISKSNLEREIAIALRYANADAMSEEGRQISDLIRRNRELEESQRDVIGAMDAVRDAGRGLFSDLMGGKNPLQSVEDALDRINKRIMDMIAENLMDQLFGQRGDPGGGSAGGWLGNLFSAFFGGGRAWGGGVRGDRMYRVGEYDRPELLNLGRGQQYLIPGDSGRVEPVASTGARGGNTYVTNVSVEGTVDRRTRNMIASDIRRDQAQAARNS